MSKFSTTSLLLLLLLLFPACGEEGTSPTPTPAGKDLTISISMPEGIIPIEGLRVGMTYYLDESQSVEVKLSQGEKSVTISHLSPTEVKSSAREATIRIPQGKLSTIDRTKKYRLTLRLTGASSEEHPRIMELNPKQQRSILHIMDLMPIEMVGEGSFQGNSASLTLTQSKEQSIVLLRLVNVTKEKKAAERITLETATERLTTSPATKSLPPKSQIKLLALLTRPSEATLTIDNVSDKIDASRLSHRGSVTAAFIGDRFSCTVPEAKVPEEANTTNGGDPLFSAEDITYWVGEGPKQAALVIDWHDDRLPHALVWGYRWEGEVTTEQMLRDVVTADQRLVLLTSPFYSYGTACTGIGYLLQKPEKKVEVLIDGVPVDEVSPHIFHAKSEKANVDAAQLTISSALWRSGWLTAGYWVYYLKDKRLAPWSYSNIGISGTTVTDKSWHGLSFQIGMESQSGNPLQDHFAPASDKAFQ